MKHSNHEYTRNHRYFDDDLFTESDDTYELDESRIKGMTKKQARRFSSRKTRSRNRPRSYD